MVTTLLAVSLAIKITPYVSFSELPKCVRRVRETRVAVNVDDLRKPSVHARAVSLGAALDWVAGDAYVVYGGA